MFDPNLVVIAAVARNGIIGRDGDLPWRLPDDLKRFRRLTMGKTLLMGRKTFQSLGKPLDGRRNWVLTRDTAFSAPPGVRVFGALDEAMMAHRELHSGEELIVIGGGELYRQTLPHAGRVELTQVAVDMEGDTSFPAIDFKDWQETLREEHAADERHRFAYCFLSLNRR